MKKKEQTPMDLIDISNKALECIVKELKDADETVDVADMLFVLGIMHRTMFANVEREKGIDGARESTSFFLNLISSTMREGAWDEENKCMK